MSKRNIAVLTAALALLAGVGFWFFSSGDTAAPRASMATGDRLDANPVAALGTEQPPRATGSITGVVTSTTALSSSSWILAEPLGDQADTAPLVANDLAKESDASGLFSFTHLPPGRYRLTAGAPDFSPSEPVEITLAEGEHRRDVRLALGGVAAALSGVVSDITGGPIADTLIEITPLFGALSLPGDRSFGIRTDSHGRYQVALLPGLYRVVASHPEYVSNATRLEHGPQPQTYDVALTPGAVIEGSVVSTTGAPVPFATVSYTGEALAAARGLSLARGKRGATTADAKGHFRLRGLGSGPVTLAASSAVGVTRDPMQVSLSIAETVSEVILVVEQGYRISGTVIERDAPNTKMDLSSLRVSATSPTGSAVTATPREDGTFVLNGLAPGQYRLSASGPHHLPVGFGTRAEIQSADLDGVSVEVRRGVRISGRVDPPSIADISIDLLPPELSKPTRRVGDAREPGGDGTKSDVDGEDGPTGFGAMRMMGPGSSVRSTPDGSFDLGPVLPETVYLTARDSDGRSGRVKVVVADTGATGVIINLETKRTISGVVIDANRAPIGNATVIIKAAQSTQRSVTMIVNGRDVGAHRTPTGADGAFRLSGLEPGVYDLSVLDPHGQRVELVSGPTRHEPTKSADLRRSDATSIVLTIDPLDGVLRGVVLGTDGRPARDAWVSASVSVAATPMDGGAMTPTPATRGGPPSAGPQDNATGDGGDHSEPKEHVSSMVMVTEDGSDDAEGFGSLGLGGTLPPILTDANGRFEIRNLRRGNYDLVAQDTRGTARAFARQVTTGDATELALIALTRLEGTVTLDGKAVRKYTITVEGPVLRRVFVRDDIGHYSIPRLDPGTYQIQVESPDGKGGTQANIVAGQIATADVALTRLVPVTGTIVDKAGQPVAGLMVVLGGGGPGRLSIMIDDDDEPARTDDQGRFRIGAPPGKHVLVAIDELGDGPRVIHPFEVSDQASMNLGTISAR